MASTSARVATVKRDPRHPFRIGHGRAGHDRHEDGRSTEHVEGRIGS